MWIKKRLNPCRFYKISSKKGSRDGIFVIYLKVGEMFFLDPFFKPYLLILLPIFCCPNLYVLIQSASLLNIGDKKGQINMVSIGVRGIIYVFLRGKKDWDFTI